MAAKKEKVSLTDFFDKDTFIIKDQNLIFQEIKFWKSIYTSINLSDGVIFKGNSEKNKVEILFNSNSNFYHLIGELDNKENSIFINLLIKHNLSAKMNMATVKLLKDVLKAKTDYLSVSKYLDRYIYSISLLVDTDGTKTTLATAFEPFKETEEDIMIDNVLNDLEYSGELSDEDLSSNLLEIYINDKDETSSKKTEEFNQKLIEIATKRIKSILKKSTESKIFFSKTENRDDNNYRYVSIESYSEDLGLRLKQLFLVII